ncbi:MAG: HPP family protein [bacterium]|nr:HPP family protein [bacterium]
MKIFDPKFKSNLKYYILQSIFATICTFIILTVMGQFAPIIVASIGSSIFLLFVMPRSKTARRRSIMGGYLIGTACGMLMSYFIVNLNFFNSIFGELESRVIFTSIGVGLSIFLMVILDVEHPPASGIALGLAFQHYNEWTILFILVSGLLLSSIRNLFGHKLKDLV